MKILVLGPRGQLGSDLFRFASRFSGSLELIPVDRSHLDVEKIQDIESALLPLAFDALINCSSYHLTDEVESNADKAYRVNAHAPKKLAELCEKKRARLIHISTDYVFSGENNKPYVETDCTGPVNIYGSTKAMGEQLIRLTHENFLIFRVASLFGVAGASGKGGNFVETMIRVGREKGELSVVSDSTMSPTATADIAQVLLQSLVEGIPSGTYHLVNSGQATWFEFAKTILETAKVPAKVLPIPSAEYVTKAQRPRFSVLDNAKIQKLTGPLPPWQEALSRYLHEKGHL